MIPGHRKGNAFERSFTKESETVDVPFSKELPPTFRQWMSAKKVETKEAADGDTWIRITNPCHVVTLSNAYGVGHDNGALIDSGANTSLQGADMGMLHQEHVSLAIVGPSDGVEYGMNDLCLVTCGRVATTSLGEEVLVIVISAAAYCKGKSISSKFQLEHNGCIVSDRARVLGGIQNFKRLKPCAMSPPTANGEK